MASTFKFHSTVGEAVPWNATYSFPTQASKVNKSIVKIAPKQNITYTSSQNVVRIEFPADGYINMQNSVLSFDVKWTLAGASRIALQRGGAHNFIKRLVIRYGGLTLEDIQEYKTLVRLFTEVGIQKDYPRSFGSVMEGIHETSANSDYATAAEGVITAAGNARVNDGAASSIVTEYLRSQRDFVSAADGTTPITRTFCLNLLSGILTSSKLLPLKWMASQLTMELYLASDAEVALYDTGAPKYAITDMSFIAEILEFDSAYDKAFFMGLQQGIPVKFSTFKNYQFNLNAPREVLQIHERARSVKAAFAVVRDNTAPTGLKDSDFFFHDIKMTHALDGSLQDPGGQIQKYQFRVGGKYYPSQPVKCSGGGSEALVELLKTVNYLGNYTTAGSLDVQTYTAFNGGKGNKFIIGVEFENTDALPDTIAGINAEEQSDIALIIEAADVPLLGSKRVDVFTHYDCLLLIKEGNVVDLVL